MGDGHRLNTPSPCVLVTRPQHQAQPFVSALQQAGFRTEVFPLIEIVPPQNPLPFQEALRHLNDYDLLLLTSVNAVHAVLDFLQQHSLEIPGHIQMVCVGPGTLKNLELRGHTAITPAHDFTAEGVVELLRGRGVAGQRALYPRAELARDVIAPALTELGARVDAPVAYRTIATTSKDDVLLEMLEKRVDIVTFTSSSAVRNYMDLLAERIAQVPERVKYASIGPITTATAAEYDLPVSFEAKPYTIPGLVAALQAVIEKPKTSSTPDTGV